MAGPCLQGHNLKGSGAQLSSPPSLSLCPLEAGGPGALEEGGAPRPWGGWSHEMEGGAWALNPLMEESYLLAGSVRGEPWGQ